MASVLAGMAAAAWWTFRIGANSRWLKPGGRHGPWGAVLWYLVPGPNLVLPFLSMQEFWNDNAANPVRPRVSGLVLPWWLALCASNAANYLGRFVAARLPGPSDPLARPAFEFWRAFGPPLAVDVTGLLAAVLFLILVL
ncbi:MAG: DUF4328 domain-containing protein, partial [Alphaproteobacteria bacterium]